MDRTSACGAEDPGSIPGERTNFPSYVRAALTAALLFPGSAAAEFGSADGVLALGERPGWSTAAPKPGSVQGSLLTPGGRALEGVLVTVAETGDASATDRRSFVRPDRIARSGPLQGRLRRNNGNGLVDKIHEDFISEAGERAVVTPCAGPRESPVVSRHDCR